MFFPWLYFAMAFFIHYGCWCWCLFGFNEYYLLQFGCIMGIIFGYWLPALILQHIDNNHTNLVIRWKLFNHSPIPLPSFQTLTCNVFRNHLVFTFVLFPTMHYAFLNRGNGNIIFSPYLHSSDLSSWSMDNCFPDSHLFSFLSFLAYSLAYDIVMWIGHYFLHSNRSIFATYHALHHSTYATCGMTGHYMGLLDFFFEAIIPSCVSSLVYAFGGSISGILIFKFLGFLNTVTSHSGYQLPGFQSPVVHYLHHKKHSVNFSFGVMDRVLGTHENGKRLLKLQNDGQRNILATNKMMD